MAKLLALATATVIPISFYCVLETSNFFFSIMLLFFPVSDSKMDQLVHLLPQIHIPWYSSITSCPVFYLKAITEAFRKKLDESWFPLYFLVTPGSTCQYVLRWFLLWLGKYYYTLQGAAALAAGVSLVSILQAGDLARISNWARNFFNIYLYYRSTTGFHAASCFWSWWVVNLLVRVKLDLYKSCRFVGLLGHRYPQYQAKVLQLSVQY